MKEASPNGGALGQVTERELDLLKASMGSINLQQTDKMLIYNLKELNQIYSLIRQKVANNIELETDLTRKSELMQIFNLGTDQKTGLEQREALNQLEANEMPEDMKKRYE